MFVFSQENHLQKYKHQRIGKKADVNEVNGFAKGKTTEAFSGNEFLKMN